MRKRLLGIGLTWLLACAAVIVALLIGAASAEAGPYRAVQCHPGLGAGHGDFDFRRTSDGYRATAACGGGIGLAVERGARRARAGSTGGWILRRPAGLELRDVRLSVAGESAGGVVPELLASAAGRRPHRFGRAMGRPHHVSYDGDARTIEARLRCARREGCPGGRDARVRLRRVTVRLRDTRAPRIDLGGPLLDGTTKRGLGLASATATDVGAGVRNVAIEVNDRPVASRTLLCKARRGIALRLRPCAARDTVSVTAVTTDAPFRQGPNLIRACALDFSRGTGANSACQTRRVRVDNACPVSGEGTKATLRAALVRRRGEAVVRGRLLAGSGAPLARAEVCVATRVRVGAAAERVVATPTTGGGGRFAVRLPRGPNREVRVAYWPSSTQVVERYAELRVRSRPRLRLRPRRTLHNGQRVRFRATLPGPARERRRVTLMVRSAGRWLPLKRGRTNRHGRWRSAYRFRSTTGERTYRFRVVVPRQAGYPYLTGRSPVRRVRVSG
jgi:hypothetical protein